MYYAADERQGNIPRFYKNVGKLSPAGPMPQDYVIRNIDDVLVAFVFPRTPGVHPDSGTTFLRRTRFLVAREEQIDNQLVRLDNTVAVFVKTAEVKACTIQDARYKSDLVFMRYAIIAGRVVVQQPVGMFPPIIIGGGHGDLDDVSFTLIAEIRGDDIQLSVRLVKVIAADGMLRAPYLGFGIL